MKFIIAISLILIMFAGCVEIENGYATDTIARVYLEGLTCKTWAVQLTNDHPTKEDSMMYGVDTSVPGLVEKLQMYQENGTRVKLHYVTKAFRNPCNYSDDDVIDSVVPV
jgi:hypothetical protein